MAALREADERNLARHYVVRGRVQGVGFRFFVEQCAQELGLAGYVKNRFDGTVEVYAIGSRHNLSTLEKRLRSGPRFAHVDRVDLSEAPLRDYHTFTIEY